MRQKQGKPRASSLLSDRVSLLAPPPSMSPPLLSPTALDHDAAGRIAIIAATMPHRAVMDAHTSRNDRPDIDSTILMGCRMTRTCHPKRYNYSTSSCCGVEPCHAPHTLSQFACATSLRSGFCYFSPAGTPCLHSLTGLAPRIPWSLSIADWLGRMFRPLSIISRLSISTNQHGTDLLWPTTASSCPDGVTSTRRWSRNKASSHT